MSARAVQYTFELGAAEVGDDPMVVGGKLCRVCQTVKLVHEFYPNRNGLRTECKICLDRRLRETNLRKKYGLSQQGYDEKLTAQGGRCAVCGTTSPGSKFKCFVVDHDHETGRVRDLLCVGCNVALGMVGDDIERLELLIAYLRRHGKGGLDG